MDIDVLDQRLRQLSGAYAQADRSGQRLGNTIAQSSVLAAPAAGAIQRLSAALFAQTAQQGQSIDALEIRLRALKAAERGIGIRREEHLQKLSASRQEIADLNSELNRITSEQNLVLRVQYRLRQERAALDAEEKTLNSKGGARTPRDARRLTEVRKEIRSNDRGISTTETEYVRLRGQEARATEAQIKAQTALNRARVAGQRDLKEQIEQVRQQRQEFKLLGASTLSVSHAFRDLGSSVARVFTFTGAAMAIRESQTFNQTLLATNVTLGTRMELWRGALEVQGRTGDSLKNLSELMLVLRGQAMLYRKDWTDVLTVASKLSQGLGASSSEIGEMLNASRALKISFRELADSVTNVVDKTSLSVRETTTLVAELRRVLTGFNAPAVGGAIDGPLRHLAALEQAMKARGASEGSALRVLKQFTSMQQKGGLGLGLLGSGGVDFLRDPTRTDAVIRNLVRFLEPVRNIPIVFEQMAASVGLAADDAQLLIDASKNLGQTERALTNNRIDLDKRFAQQAAVSGQAWGQFGRQLQALLLEGLTPLTRGVVTLGEWLVKLRGFLAEVKEATPNWIKSTAATTATTVAVVAMGTAAAMAARRVWLTVVALRALGTGGMPGVGRGGLPTGIPGAPVPTWWGRLTTPARRAATIPGVPRAVGGVPGVGRATSLAGGAARLLTGLLPALVEALPVLIPVVLAGVAAWGAYKFFQQYQRGKEEDAHFKQITQEALEKRAQGYQIRGSALNDILQTQSGVAAGKKLQEELAKSWVTMVRGAERMGASEVKSATETLRSVSDMIQAKLEANQATESREKPYATTERLDELVASRKELVQAMREVKDTLVAISEAGKRFDVEQQKRAQQEQAQAAEKVRVEQAARGATMLRMLPGKI